MKYCIRILMLLLTLATSNLISYTAHAQASGSIETVQGLGIASGGTHASVSESLNIGPGNYQIDGAWEIYSKNVVIDPNAVITGAGSIVLYNPSTAGGTASITQIDGNGSSNAIGVNVVLQNASGALLTNIDFPTDLTASGYTNSSSNNLYIGKDLSLAIDGANVFLNGNDLIFTSSATVSNYTPLRFVITSNSISGHMVKQNYTGSFTFPVGIETNDYTPAMINISTANTMHVSVQSYNASAADETLLTRGGVNRTWHIYSDVTGTATIDLQHNKTTASSPYNDNSANVTQYISSAWSTTTCGAGTGTGTLTTGGSLSTASELSRVVTVDNTNTYYTKTGCVAPDLIPIIYIQPTNVYGTQPITVVVKVYEIKNVATSGLITVRVSKDSRMSLTFDTGATSVGGNTVQNSAWNFDGSSNTNFYILTTNQVISGGGVLSFGLSGTLNPGTTTGSLTVNATIIANSGGEVVITNNIDAERVDYFQQ